jgi:hypothetical protein
VPWESPTSQACTYTRISLKNDEKFRSEKKCRFEDTKIEVFTTFESINIGNLMIENKGVLENTRCFRSCVPVFMHLYI